MATNNPFEDLEQKLQQNQQATAGDRPSSSSGDGIGDYLADFAQSAGYAGTSELVGYDPPQDVRKFRAENPWAGFASQVAGQVPWFAIPLSRVGMAGARALPGIGRGVRGGEKLMQSGRPVLGQAGRDISAISAYELPRIGATAGIQGPLTEETGEVAAEALTEIGLTGVVSGALAHLSRSMPPGKAPGNFEKQIQDDLDPEFNLNATPQFKMQRAAPLMDTVEQEGIRDELFRHIKNYSHEVRSQNKPEGRRAVQKLEDLKDRDARNLAGRLDNMFGTKDTRDLQVRKIIDSEQEGGLGKGGTRSLLDRANLPNMWEQHAFIPRYNKIKTKEQARKFQKTLNEVSTPMTAGGRQMWMRREAGDGAFVMVRRVDDKSGPVEAGDEFITFKTDDPSFFAPELSRFTQKLDNEAMRVNLRDRQKKSEGTITRAMDDLQESSPNTAILSGEMARGRPSQELARRVTESIFGQERIGQIRQAFGESFDWIGRHTREFAAPTIARYGGRNGNARAAHISLMSKLIFDRAQGEITDVISGRLKPDYRTSLWKDIRAPQEAREGGVFELIDNLPNDALPEVSEAFRRAMSIGDMEKAGMSKNAVDFMRGLARADRRVIRDFNRTMRDLDMEEFEGIDNHYMLSRMWEGRHRVPIRRRSDGAMVAVASGKTGKSAREEAERLREVIKEDGVDVEFNPREVRYADEGDDLQQAIDIGGSGNERLTKNQEWLRKARDPSRFEERQGVRGFQFEREDFTHKDLRNITRKQVAEMYNLAAKRTVERRLADDLHKLGEEDQQFYWMINKELMARFGERGGWTKATEDAVDRILMPVLGSKASEIVRTVNGAVFQLTLGMGNVGFAALNAVTFMQTALPEISWLMHAAPERVRALYGHSIVNTPKGVGEVRYLEPLRFVRQAWNDMSNPPDELWQLYQRARGEGRVSPVLAEEVMGPNADFMRHLRGFFQGHRTVPEVIKEASTYMPARTEEISRSMSLSMGYRMGKDFMGLSGEQLYQFATRFVDNTHFRYASADRPLLLRGAFGSLLGLFKSWMLHYVGNMTRYAGESWRQRNFLPLLWSQAGTMSVAGLSGSAVLPVAEGLNDMASDDPLVQNLYEGMGFEGDDSQFLGSPADALYYGAPAFLNLSLSHRAAVPGADIPNDIEQLYSVMHWDRAVAIGNMIGGSIDSYYATGEHPMGSQQVRDAAYRAFLPRTAQAIMKNVGQRGSRSLRTQNTILSDTTWAETTIDALGFQPNRIARAYEQMDVLFERTQERQEKISAFGAALAQAREEYDPAAVQNVLMRAQNAGVSIDSVMRSADSRQAKRGEGIIERQFTDWRDIGLRRALGGDYP